MPSSARELQIYPYIPRLTEYFSDAPSGHNPFPKAFPSGEGGSRVPRKRETDEGVFFFSNRHGED